MEYYINKEFLLDTRKEVLAVRLSDDNKIKVLNFIEKILKSEVLFINDNNPRIYLYGTILTLSIGDWLLYDRRRSTYVFDVVKNEEFEQKYVKINHNYNFSFKNKKDKNNG